MLSEIPSVDITRSLYHFLFAALVNCFVFLDFDYWHICIKDFQVFLFIWGCLNAFNDIIVASAVSNHSELQSKLLPTLFGNIELICFDALEIILFFTNTAVCFDIYSLNSHVTLIRCWNSQFALPNQFLAFSVDLDLSPYRLHIQSILFIQPDIYKCVEKL